MRLDVYSYSSDFAAGTDAANYIVTYSEALFIQAEATLIKSGVAAAEPFYYQGNQSHFLKLGFYSASAEVRNYISSRSLTAANALQRIMEEKSIANFLNIENYTDWGRTGFPANTEVIDPFNGMNIPRRLLYTEGEILSNPQARHSTKITDRVWWDKR